MNLNPLTQINLFEHKEIFNQLKTLSDRGYFPVAFNFEENSFNMEVMFQRHPKQTEEMKMVEIKI